MLGVLNEDILLLKSEKSVVCRMRLICLYVE